MLKPLLHSKALLLAALALALLLGLSFLSTNGSRHQGPALSSPAVPHADNAGGSGVASSSACLPGQCWGGAYNSAGADGAGFFDRQAAKQFMSAVKPELRKYVIDLQARALLPLPGAENIAAVFPESVPHVSGPQTGQPPAASEQHVAYLQFKDHPRENERRQLAAQDVELLNYVSGYAWCARGTPAAFQAVLHLDFVRAVAAVDARDKLQALVFQGDMPPYAGTTAGRARFWLLAQPGTTPRELARQMAGDQALVRLPAKPVKPSVLGPRFEIVTTVATARCLAALDAAAYLSFVPPPFANRHPTAPAASAASSRDATTDLESNIGAVRDNPPNLSGNGVTVVAREIGTHGPARGFCAAADLHGEQRRHRLGHRQPRHRRDRPDRLRRPRAARRPRAWRRASTSWPMP